MNFIVGITETDSFIPERRYPYLVLIDPIPLNMTDQLTSPETIRRMSIQERDKLSKSDLKKALATLISDQSADQGLVGRKLDAILNEMKEMRADNLKERQRMSKLEERVEILEKVCKQQQLFLEQVDAKERERNVIMLGIPEDDQSDEKKVEKILSSIGTPEDKKDMFVKRLGSISANMPRGAAGNRRHRPVHVQLSTREKRDNVLRNAKKLKEGTEDERKIYIKKDLHPGVRKELDRLRRAEREERNKPENAGKTITYDHKQRILLCDGQVIDRYQPFL